ncbi:hypothetical protein ACN6AX_00730 [Paenibacillus polymyxa]|uniref:hypothetical protein n=1 Tax=Paenibacillus polymyxa TaxID=1406 RepID=UPI00211D7408|nr:hypothetical protein [Paenibacillus polymyxa]
MNELFLVLIGSVARDDFSLESDVDVCRISYSGNVERKSTWPSGPINYVDYSYGEFIHLYDSGSLFIHHILNEGILLQGNNKSWEYFRNNFKLKINFNEELLKIREISSIFSDINLFDLKYLSMYSNLFTLVKNFSIFYLANKKKYLFNKRTAIKLVFGEFHTDLLIDSYNYFERGIVNDKWDYSSKEEADKILNYYLTLMEDLY